MHRGRNRSRKPVESPQNISLSTSSSSSVTTTMPTGGGGSSSSSAGGGGSSSASGRLLTAGASFQNLPFHAFGSSQATAPASASSSAIHQAQFHLDSIPYAIPNKDYRYLHGLKPELVGHNYFSEASGSNRGLLMESNMDNVQPLMPSRVSSFPPLKPLESSLLHGDYHQHSSVASGFASEGHGKQDGQSLRPFFNEWPKARDSWSGLEDDRSNNTSFSTTQLSISIPMPPSDFSTSSQSPPCLAPTAQQAGQPALLLLLVVRRQNQLLCFLDANVERLTGKHLAVNRCFMRKDISENVIGSLICRCYLSDPDIVRMDFLPLAVAVQRNLIAKRKERDQINGPFFVPDLPPSFTPLEGFHSSLVFLAGLNYPEHQ
ncbi:hypothetical protein Dimus_000014 [Dionaea muscipula]